VLWLHTEGNPPRLDLSPTYIELLAARFKGEWQQLFWLSFDVILGGAQVHTMVHTIHPPRSWMVRNKREERTK
jgi:hypothetical protein